jgi:TBC1 domain family member 13
MLSQSSLARMRALYRSFVDELIVNPQQKAAEDDHPLATSEKSTWNAYFKDSDLDFEIVKDAKRTFPQLHFFNHDPMNGDTTHYEALRRLLFVYAKLNPGIRYVQGMNELLAPIYYLFANAVGAHDRAENQAPTRDDAEADAFFCFTTLMSEVMNNFCKTLDSSEVGVHADMRRLNALLREKDAELWANLEQKGLSPQFYSFRWLTLLLSQEFELPDVMRLWDSLFADARRFEYLQFFCCAMLSAVRDQLFLNDFASNLKLLQKYPPIDPFLIHRRARELQAADYVAPPRPVAPSDSVLDDDDGAATGTGIVVVDAPSVVASAPVAAAAPAPPPAAANAAPPDSSPSPVRLLKNWFRRAASGTQ